ncbi:hypothetical protein H1R20_g7422, partial [Candolleomyces eurysporus]
MTSISSSSRWVKVDNSDSRIFYAGVWLHANAPLAYEGSLIGTRTQGSQTFRFTGNAARIVGANSSQPVFATDAQGTTINGTAEPDWDCILNGTTFPKPLRSLYVVNPWVVCDFPNLPTGQHTIEVKVKSNARLFWLDEIQYDPGVLVQDEVRLVRYDDVNVTYSEGGWEPYSQGGQVVGRSTNVRGSTATLRFFGNEITVVAAYPNTAPQDPIRATYSIDGHGGSFSIQNGGGASDFYRRVVKLFDLSNEEHTLELTFNGAPTACRTTVMKESYVDVLIVGAGPAGLMAANALARAGINVRVVEKRATAVNAGHADGIQPRTIEIFQVTLHQGRIEKILLDSMEQFGVKVERSTVPTVIQLTDDQAKLADPGSYAVKKVVLQRLDADDSFETVQAKFVIGADGAHSWVRKSLGISMEGEQTDSVWGVIDVRLETDFPDIRAKSIINSNTGTCFIIPREDDKDRIYIQLDGTNMGLSMTCDGRVDKTAASPEKLLAVAQEIMKPFRVKQIGECEWWTVYSVGQRVASSYSAQERVFIVGDACHTHSPKAGQGMNASMGDSHNLAWKLTHVLRGWAGLQLLKTYESERRKFAQDLIAFDKVWAKLFTGKPRTEENQDGVTHEEFLRHFQTFGGFSSNVGIHYEASAITNTEYQDVAQHLPIGQRMIPQVFIRAADGRPIEIQDMLPADTRLSLLVFTGDIDFAKKEKLQELCDEFERVITTISRSNTPSSEVFRVISIAGPTLRKVEGAYLELPALLRSHWSSVLVDDLDTKGKQGGDGYTNYGIDQSAGAVVLVRPDGYVGTVAPFNEEGVKHLKTYLNGFINLAKP